MTEHRNTSSTNRPVATHRDGTISIKVWRNFARDGRPVYSTTIQRTYSDPKTGEPRDSHSLSRDDLLKLPELAGEARRSIRHFQEQDRTQNREMEQPDRHGQTLADERDAAMANAAPDHDQSQARQQTRQGPHHEPGMG